MGIYLGEQKVDFGSVNQTDLTEDKYATKDELGNGKVEIWQGSARKGSFTLNQKGDARIDLEGAGPLDNIVTFHVEPDGAGGMDWQLYYEYPYEGGGGAGQYAWVYYTGESLTFTMRNIYAFQLYMNGGQAIVTEPYNGVIDIQSRTLDYLEKVNVSPNSCVDVVVK